MIDDLLVIQELTELLGYKDQKSVQTWCKKNKVPLIRVGRRIYASRPFIDKYILEKIEQFLRANYSNPDEVMNALKRSDLGMLSEATKPVSNKKVEHVKTRKNSPAAEDFLKKLRELS